MALPVWPGDIVNGTTLGSAADFNSRTEPAFAALQPGTLAGTATVGDGLLAANISRASVKLPGTYAAATAGDTFTIEVDGDAPKVVDVGAVVATDAAAWGLQLSLLTNAIDPPPATIFCEVVDGMLLMTAKRSIRITAVTGTLGTILGMVSQTRIAGLSPSKIAGVGLQKAAEAGIQTISAQTRFQSTLALTGADLELTTFSTTIDVSGGESFIECQSGSGGSVTNFTGGTVGQILFAKARRGVGRRIVHMSGLNPDGKISLRNAGGATGWIVFPTLASTGSFVNANFVLMFMAQDDGAGNIVWYQVCHLWNGTNGVM